MCVIHMWYLVPGHNFNLSTRLQKKTYILIRPRKREKKPNEKQCQLLNLNIKCTSINWCLTVSKELQKLLSLVFDKHRAKDLHVLTDKKIRINGWQFWIQLFPTLTHLPLGGSQEALLASTQADPTYKKSSSQQKLIP